MVRSTICNENSPVQYDELGRNWKLAPLMTSMDVNACGQPIFGSAKKNEPNFKKKLQQQLLFQYHVLVVVIFMIR